MQRGFEVADGVTAIDTMMAGRDRLTSAYLVASPEPALIETGPGTSVETVTEALHSLGLGAGDLAHIIVSHIHLDHAGGAGEIARKFPSASVWVHERGAQHLADPGRLLRSATRTYGEDRMRLLFGEVVPVEAGRLRAVSGGERISLVGRYLTVLYTPGHASHHVALQDSRTGAVFTGDAVGVHIPDLGILRPASPPPEFDIELAVESIGKIQTHARDSLLFSHFGPVSAVDETCDLAVKRIRQWGEIVRVALQHTDQLEQVENALREATAEEYQGLDVSDAERFEILSGFRMNAAGLARYWKKRSESRSG